VRVFSLSRAALAEHCPLATHMRCVNSITTALRGWAQASDISPSTLTRTKQWFLEAAAAYRDSAFRTAMRKLRHESDQAFEFLQDLEPRSWARSQIPSLQFNQVNTVWADDFLQPFRPTMGINPAQGLATMLTTVAQVCLYLRCYYCCVCCFLTPLLLPRAMLSFSTGMG